MDLRTYFWSESEYIYFFGLLKAFYVFLFIMPSFHLLCFADTQSFICLLLFCCHWYLKQTTFAFCWMLFHQSSMKHPHTNWHAHTAKNTEPLMMLFFFVFYAFGTLFAFEFIHFIFCWQQNGTSRFHGLASLDDITAIISTPPLGGFQVATPISLIWC